MREAAQAGKSQRGQGGEGEGGRSEAGHRGLRNVEGGARPRPDVVGYLAVQSRPQAGVKSRAGLS